MGDIRVFIVDTKDPSFAGNREALLTNLSEYRIGKIQACSANLRTNAADEALAARHEAVRDLCIAAGLVTEIGLGQYGLHEKDMQYGFVGRGKPVFLNHPEIHFNISHSGHYAVAAFSEKYDPGIDIEQCSRVSSRIIYGFFSESERELILSQPDEASRRLMFGRIWTVREAFVKAGGMGIAAPKDGYRAVLRDDGRLAIEQECFEGRFGTFELNPVGDYCISVVGRQLSGAEAISM